MGPKSYYTPENIRTGLVALAFVVAYIVLKGTGYAWLVEDSCGFQTLLFLIAATYGLYRYRHYAYGPRSILGLRFPQGHCQFCGYDRREIVATGPCPECGKRTGDKIVEDDETCG